VLRNLTPFRDGSASLERSRYIATPKPGPFDSRAREVEPFDVAMVSGLYASESSLIRF
jgi:hypothetical protein